MINAQFDYCLNKASEAKLVEHLLFCDAEFVETLNGRIQIGDYATKLVAHAERFEAWLGNDLVGLVAAYCNDPLNQTAYISNVSVWSACSGQGVAYALLQRCVAHARARNLQQIDLEVSSNNFRAIDLYAKCGFVFAGGTPFAAMKLKLLE